MKKVIVMIVAVMMLATAFTACAPAAEAPAAEAPAAEAPAAEAPAAEAPAAEEPAEPTQDSGLDVEQHDVEGKTIAFCYQDLETEFWVAAHQAITAELTAQGCEVLEYNANEDANRQLEQVRDAIAAGVDGVILIPQDGDSAVTIAKECNKEGVPIGVFNRPPSSEEADNLVVVADNKAIAEEAVDYMVEQCKIKYEQTGEKINAICVVGDLGDPNAVYRREGFYAAIEKEADIFNPVVEVDSKWDADVALTNLTAAVQANPDVDLVFVGSDFLFPVVQSVLEPLGKWQVAGHEDHVYLGGVDGDSTAGRLIDEGYVDATGVQDLFNEANLLLNALLSAIEAGDPAPNEWLNDPGFALTQGNVAEKHDDMWGNVVGG